MTTEVRFGDWSLRPIAGELRYDGRPVGILSEREEQLVLLLHARDGLPLTAKQVTRILLGVPVAGHESYAKGLVRRVRLRARATLIVRTSRGYSLDPEARPEGACLTTSGSFERPALHAIPRARDSSRSATSTSTGTK